MYVYEKCIFRGAELTISNGVADYMVMDSKFDKEANECMNRFFQQDWGELSPRALKSNDLLLAHHMEPIMGMYDTSRGKVVVIASCFSQGEYNLVEVALYSEVFHLYRANK